MDGDTRPTFEQAFAASESADASPASTPAETPAPADHASAATTVPPADTPAPAVTEPAPTAGEPPKDRWPDILNNAREKARQDAVAQWDQQYGWAKQVAQYGVTDFNALVQMAQSVQRQAQDPVGFVVEALNDLVTHPQYAQQIRSHAARVLGTRPQPAATDAPMEPGIPVQDEHGNVVARTYTDAQIQQLMRRAIEEYAGKEIAPIKERFEKQDQDTRERELHAQVQTTADQLLDRAEKWPGFTDHKAEIAKVYDAHPQFSLQDAYLDVLNSTILPKLNKAEEAKVVATFQQKANAATLNPSAATAVHAVRPKSFHDPSLKWS